MPPEVVGDGIIPCLAAVAAFLVGVVIIVLLHCWRKKRDALPSQEADLESFHALYDEGHLSREELERIRVQLAARHDRVREHRLNPPDADS